MSREQGKPAGVPATDGGGAALTRIDRARLIQCTSEEAPPALPIRVYVCIWRKLTRFLS